MATSQNQAKTYVSLMLWKKSGRVWTDEELIPVRNLTVSGTQVTVAFVNGDKKEIFK